MHCQFCGAALESLPVACPFCAAQPVLGDRYEIRSVIGHGGMGEVFLAYDRRLANDVAIKRLTPQLASNAELRDSLTKEARIMARLSDSAIVRLFDLAEFYGDLYLILEYVCGPSLRDMIRAGYRAPALELARILGDVCQGLTAAHAAGVIHRDLKPSNLLLALEGADHDAYRDSRKLPASLAGARTKITDFGIAKAIADSRVTLTNAFSGTPGYMAPEQFRGEKPSPETDVYALGVLTCELLTGKLPSGAPQMLPGVHPAVVQVVAKAMAAGREYRFPSAAAYYEALSNAIEGRFLAMPVRRPLRPARPSRPLALVWIALAFGVIAAWVTFRVASTNLVGTPSRQLNRNPFDDDQPVEMEAHALMRVAELPPVVGEAIGKPAADGLTGPRNPKLRWSLTLPVIASTRIVAIGKDDTVYVTGMQEICAVRDGRLRWAYKAGMTGVSDVQLAKDGRLWFRSMDSVYCLNRDGQGGRLPSGFQAPEEPKTDRPFLGCGLDSKLVGRAGTVDLDGSCTTAGVVGGRDGISFVATDVPQILAVDRGGRFVFKFTTSCDPTVLVPVLNNQLFFACKNASMHWFDGKSESWTRVNDGVLLNSMVADSEGTVYYGDYSRNNGQTHLHAIDRNGTIRWTVDTRGASVTMMALGAGRRLYVSGSAMHGRLLCLSD